MYTARSVASTVDPRSGRHASRRPSGSSVSSVDARYPSPPRKLSPARSVSSCGSYRPLERKLSGCSVSTSCSWADSSAATPLSILLGNAIGRAEDLDEQQRDFLHSLRLPAGVAEELVRSHEAFPVRLWILDNSGSMSTGDGHRCVQTKEGPRMVACTRWAELGASLEWHAQVSAQLGAATEFQLLNQAGRSTVRVGFGHGDPEQEVEQVRRLCATEPRGRTPLCQKVREAIERIEEVAPALRAAGQRAVLVIASDGAATDGDIAAAMRPLRDLPVWVVVRLCTDEDEVLNYWNNVDEELELDMDVLDDLAGEAAEVKENNAWLTYGEPLHQVRERGAQSKLFDLIDEKSFKLTEVRAMAELIFGPAAAALPHPDLDWAGFLQGLEMLNRAEPLVRDPLRKQGGRKPLLRTWISTKKLRRQRAAASCSIM